MSIITIKIENLKGVVIFSHAAQNNTARKTVEKAVAAGVSLAYADLRDCNLSHAKLRNADFF